MTIAICSECGKRKFGAFSPCDRCGFTPTSITEQAKSVMLSDHHHTRDELDRFSKAIQAGEAITYDPVVLALNVRVFERMDADPDAFQCTICSGNVDSFDETLCPKCQEHKQ